MIAKLIVWGEDRNIARQRMILSLNNYIIQGIHTNIPYLNALLQHIAFIENKISTRFCDTHTEEILLNMMTVKNARSFEFPLFSYLLFSLTSHYNENASLWENIGYWRINNGMNVRIDGQDCRLELLHRIGNHFHFKYDGKDYKASLIRNEKGKIEMTLNNNHFIAYASSNKKYITQITYEGLSFTCERKDILVEQEIFSLAGYSSSAGDQRIVSPMPGKVVKVNVAAGSDVKKGDILLVVEAMKMENNITSPKDGLIESVHAKQGEMVDPSTELLKFVTQ